MEPWSQLEDLDFVDDLALLSHSHQQIQEKTDLLNTVSTQKANTKNNNLVTLGGEPLEETGSFRYLGSTINKSRDTEFTYTFVKKYQHR